MSNYHALNEQMAIEYAANIPDLFPQGCQLTCREIGDGNLNLVFHITDELSQLSIILKQALPYAKVVGESWPLTLDRARIESQVLMIQESLCPELVPHVYLYDAELALTVMEDLSDHVIMRKGLIAGNRYPLFPQHMASFLANTLFYTSDLGMNQQDKKKRLGQFINPELCKITEDLIFDHPYINAETNQFNPLILQEVEALWSDQELHLQVALLREQFLTHAQALLHGDLHTGSIFVTETSTKVIDPEFAFYGPIGFDIGAILANLLLNYVSQESWNKDEHSRRDYLSYLLHSISEVWSRFAQEFRELWNTHCTDRLAMTAGYQELYMRRLLQDTIGYAGCKMIRRIVGLAHVEDIDTIVDANERARAEKAALAIGTALVKLHRHASSIDEVLDIAKKTSSIHHKK